MPVTVNPTIDAPTHDVSLSDGAQTFGLILGRATGLEDEPLKADPTALVPQMVPRVAFKTAVGDNKYSDLEPPYFAIAQDNWNSGRGKLQFEEDATRYMDGKRADTLGEGVICGPKETQGTGYWNSYAPHTQNNTKAFTGNSFASRYVPSATYTIRRIQIFVKNVTSGTWLTAAVWNDSGGNPTTILMGTVGVLQVDHDIDADGEILSFSVVTPVTSGAACWISCNAASPGSAEFGVDGAATGFDIRELVGGTWYLRVSNQSVWFVLYDIFVGIRRFIEYRSSLYCVNQADDFSPARLFENGYHGLCVDNQYDKTKTNTHITINENLAGKIVKVVAGGGSKERVTWRTIVSNTTGANAVLTVDKPWFVAHDATTEIAIIGCNSFREITGHGLTKPVTSMVVVGDYIYFAQGELDNMVRFRAYNNSGTWTYQGVEDGANQFDYLCLSPKDTGSYKLWGAKAQACTIYSADLVTSWTNSTFTQENGGKACGSTGRKITGLISYGDPPIPFVLKEGSIGGVNKGIYAEAPLGEMNNLRAEENGRASLQHGAYLYFTLLKGLEQFYNNDLRDMGPNRDEGLPAGRIGAVVKLVGYAGRFYAAVNAGDDGYSSVLCYRDPGWMEVYRGPLGSRIEGMDIQVIPGETADRLWIGQEEDIYWLPIAPTPRQQADYTYYSGAQIESGWITAGRVDTQKVWSAIKLFTENLVAGHQYVHVDYMIDGNTNWISLGNITTSPRQELALGVTAHRIRYRITLYTDNVLLTPWVRAVVIEGVETLPAKYSFGMTFILADQNSDLNGEDDTYTDAEQLFNQLASWMGNGTMLTFRSRYGLWDNRYVRIQSLTARPVSLVDQAEKHLGSIEVMDV